MLGGASERVADCFTRGAVSEPGWAEGSTAVSTFQSAPIMSIAA